MAESNRFSPDHPYTQNRVVQWGECDPAGMVYTTQFLDYVMETVEGFFRDVIGFGFLEMHKKHGYGSPTISTKLDFQKPLRGGDPFMVELRIAKLSRSTITYDIKGRNKAGEVCFTGAHVSCIIDEKIVKSVEIPDVIRAPIERYIAATGLASAA